MQLIEFQDFIKSIPYKNQSFDIKYKIWKIDSQQKLIDRIFNGEPIITINRNDLLNANWDIKEFIIKTLMWGYPTKGRGRNIENILESNNFEQLARILETYFEKDITIEQLKHDIKSIQGLGLSTITKFTHFLNTTIEGNKAVILDIQIIEAINSQRFVDFNHLKGITYENAPNRYLDYLKTINEITKRLGANPDQVEMFLFTFGRSLSPINSHFQDKMNSGEPTHLFKKNSE